MRTEYRKEIEIAALNYHLDPNLIEALVLTESLGQTYAYRYEGAFWAKYMAPNPLYSEKNPVRVSASYGLTQVLYVVAVELGYTFPDPEYLFVPSINLNYGCYKLRQLLDWAHGNTSQALAAYNGGRVANTKPPYRNQTYVDRVMKAFRG